MVRAPDPKLLEFLAAYDPRIGELALALRRLVLKEAPGAAEMIYKGYAVSVGFTFTGRMKEMFVHVVAYAKYVNLGFNRGTELPDPHHLLEGSGTWTRHIRVSKPEDLKQPHLVEMIRHAIDRAMLQRGPKPQTQVVVKSMITGKKKSLSAK